MNATAESVMLKWEPPLYVDEGRRYWYTLSYKTRTPQGFNNPLTVIDFINTPSKTLINFILGSFRRFVSSKIVSAVDCLEPCTVPQSLRLDARSHTTPELVGRSVLLSSGSYVIQFSQEPAPQFRYWKRYRCGNSKRFTITDLAPDTRSTPRRLLEMNTRKFLLTKQWWYDDEDNSQMIRPLIPLHAMDIAGSDVASTLSAIR
uniref:Fibronectin type-III domain-containing protein n=1 Tax=Parascaris equorum TaxID=6256 RepID=A0A914RZ63_PAREQ